MPLSPSSARALYSSLSSSPLLTARLRLRPPRAGDGPALFAAYTSDAQAIKYLSFMPHTQASQAESFVGHLLSNWKAGAGELALVIERQSDGVPVGVIGMALSSLGAEHGGVLGYVLARSAWGQGYMSEALDAMISLAFLFFHPCWRVWATCHPENVASRRVMEKCGMTYEGTLRAWSVRPLLSSAPGDSDCLSITLEEWRSRPPSEATRSLALSL